MGSVFMMPAVTRFAVVFLLIILAIVTGKFVVADFYLDRASDNYNQLDFEKLRNAKSLESVIHDIDQSLKWRRDNAQALDLKATLLYQQWWLSPDAQFFSESKLLRDAEKYHLDALKLRHDWSFTLAQLALIHSNKEALDNDFSHWFSKAYEFGRYETVIARTLMEVGLRFWSQLNQSQKEMTLEFARISIEIKSNSSQAMKALLIQYGQLAFICNHTKRTERQGRVCTDE